MSDLLGSPMSFAAAVVVVIIWALSGPLFGFSATWQLVINTGTTIVTFLMIFLVQNTQNRDSLAIQLKLDELLRGIQGPRTTLVDLEELSDTELRRLREEFRAVAEQSGGVTGDPARLNTEEDVEAEAGRIAEETVSDELSERRAS